MKKFFKLLIALVLIAGLAVGAYFVFKNKDNSKNVYNNVYELTYNVKDKNKHTQEELAQELFNQQGILLGEQGGD